MSAISSLIASIAAVLMNWVAGLAGLAELIWMALKAVRAEEGFKKRMISQLEKPPGMRQVLAVLRAFWPNLVLSTKLAKSYENTGTALVTRQNDVLEVLSRNDDFEVVYGPRMREITDGENFFLGMQPGWEYDRDTSAMLLAMRRTDVASIVQPRAVEIAAKAVDACDGIVDLPQDVGLKTSSDMVAHYFGTPGPSADLMIDWTTKMFWYLFADLGASEDLKKEVLPLMADCRAYLDQAIADRKAKPTKADDVLNRCLALQSAGTPGMDDLGIRNNLVGLLIGAVPTLSKASCLALEELLRRPADLALAQKAAREGNDEMLAHSIWEALRFNPHQPVLYRRALRDTSIAHSTLREVKIPKGTMVFAATLSAAFDPLQQMSPETFRTDRPRSAYMTWGYGMHNCFGEAINLAVIPAILKPVLKLRNLRYAPGTAGIDTDGTPFPVHMKLAYDPA